jgi:hypothetical protein
MLQTTTKTSARTPLAPVSFGYADVNGIELYHEIHGEGKPLVLLHGGLMTIGEMSAPFEILDDDIAALLDHPQRCERRYSAWLAGQLLMLPDGCWSHRRTCAGCTSRRDTPAS